MRLKHFLSVFLTLLTLSVGQMWGAAASLPFEYDGNGQGELPDGLTVHETGTYNSSPKIKFDTQGDYIMIQFSDTPDKLNYKLKTNGSGSTTYQFDVLQSANGTDWTTVKSYTEAPSGTADESIALDASSRYVKFIYTAKPSGLNMALGSISISKISKFTVSYNANGGTGTAPTDATLYNPNAQVTVLGQGNVTREGCTFAGWNTKADGTGMSYAADATFSISANTTLYAKWTATVTWKANNVIVKTDDIVVPAAGKTVTLPTDGEIGSNKCGDRIMGWTESETYKANTAPADLFTAAPTVQGSKTYYAVFADYAPIVP